VYDEAGWLSIVTELLLDDLSYIPVRGKEFISSPPRPDQLWTPPSHLSNECRGIPPRV